MRYAPIINHLLLKCLEPTFYRKELHQNYQMKSAGRGL